MVIKLSPESSTLDISIDHVELYTSESRATYNPSDA